MTEESVDGGWRGEGVAKAEAEEVSDRRMVGRGLSNCVQQATIMPFAAHTAYHVTHTVPRVHAAQHPQHHAHHKCSAIHATSVTMHATLDQWCNAMHCTPQW